MRAFRMDPMPDNESTVDRLFEAMTRYNLQPDYQRQSSIWGEEKRQLFIDSLINGYDVPKLYFHRLDPTADKKNLYAIVDGKQRLETIRSFLRNEFPLGDDFTDVQAESDDQESEAAGKHYRMLTLEHPSLASRLTQAALHVVIIDTKDEGIIEELFSRLNEAVPLNAPEKRNALGGAMPPIIRRLVRSHAFFTDRLPIENTRYRQYDLITKFLYLAANEIFLPTKKRALDDFVKSFRDTKGKPKNEKLAARISKKTTAVLNTMSDVFVERDELLTSVGLSTVYFLAFLFARSDAKLAKTLTRDALLKFDQVRRHNRQLMRQEQSRVASGKRVSVRSRVRQDLAIFDRLMQSPNDGQALEFRFRILKAFLSDRQFTDSLPKDLKARIGTA